MDRYKIFLLLVFAVVWTWAAIEPAHPDDWLLENYLVFIFVPIVLFVGRYFKLSNISYTLITIFAVMHIVGSHYTYTGVPFGFTLGEWFGYERNIYDRIVHFSFGLLVAYPVREVFMRVAKVRGVWAFFLPLNVVMAMSGTYEVIEWLAVRAVENPETTLTFLGMQGDAWDAQKDMALAFLGALVALGVVALINWIYNKDFAREIKESLKIEKGDKPLGEVALYGWIEEKSKYVKSTTRR